MIGTSIRSILTIVRSVFQLQVKRKVYRGEKAEMIQRSKLSIIADPGTLFLGILATTVGFCLCSGIVIHYVFWGELYDVVGSLCVFGTLDVLCILVAIIALPRWYTRITLLQESVIIKTALKQPIERPYKYYQYVYKAWYWHGSPIGVGKNVDYIVISHRRLRDEELANINQLAPDSDVLKIRYSSKNYQKLMDILPREMQYKLKVCGFQ